MSSTLRRIGAALSLFCGTATFAQTVNPAGDIRWSIITGSGAPGGSSCTTANVGQPYIDLTTPRLYTCGGSAGWLSNPGTVISASGAPSGSGTNGTLYFDTSTSPATGYVRLAGAWVQFGGGAAGSSPSQISSTFLGVPAASQIIVLIPIDFVITVPSGCTNSHMDALTAATASTTFTLYYRSGGITGTLTSFGTAVFSASGQSASFTCSSSHAFSAGDYLEVIGPSTADATLANIGFGLYGTH